MTKINSASTTSTLSAINAYDALTQVQQDVNTLMSTSLGSQGTAGIQGNVGFQGSSSGSVPGGNNYSIQYNNNNSFDGIQYGSTGTVLCSFGSSFVPSFNALSSSGGFGSPKILGATFACINTSITATSTYDVYTVPDGYRAIMLSWSFYNNGSVAISSSNYLGIYAKISGTSYLVNIITFGSINTNTAASGGSTNMKQYIFDQGETIQLAVATSVTEIYFKSSLIIFPISMNPYLYTIKKYSSWISGNNTIYTVPSNSYSLVYSYYFNIYSMDPVGNTELVYLNQTGSSVTLTSYVVPSGGSVSNIYKTSYNSTSVSNNGISTCGIPKILNAGDFIVLNSSTANNTQIAYITVYNVSTS